MRDAGIIFAASALAGGIIGFALPTDAIDLALIVTVSLGVLLIRFGVAGAHRWRHLLVMAVVTWILDLVSVVLGTSDLVGWLGATVLLAPIVGPTGLFATLVHRLRTAS